MKRFLARLLLAAMLLQLTACAGSTPAESTAGDESTPAVSDSEPLHPRETIPVRDFGGAEFCILAATNYPVKYEAEETGDIFNDAVYRNNLKIEEDFGVKLKFQFELASSKGHDAVTAALNGSVLSGDAAFDISVNNTAYVEKWILGGMFADLAEMEYLNFDDPWWYKNVNDSLVVNGRQFTCSGGYALNAVSDSYCVLYNRELNEALSLANPYDAVYDGTWTWDRWMEMARQGKYDLNGDTVMNQEDRFGILSRGSMMFTTFQFGLGHRIVENNADGKPAFVGVTEKTVDIMDKLAALFNDREIYFPTVDNMQETIRMFVTGHALTLAHQLFIIETDEMRQGPDYGILPPPKLDEDQEQYYTYCFMDSYQIPKVVKDAKMSQIVLNALNCYTYYDVLPMYKESVLQNKLARDDDSAAVIDLLVEGVVTDFACIFLQALDNALLYSYSVFKNQSWTTWWASNEVRLQENLDNLLQDIEALE